MTQEQLNKLIFQTLQSWVLEENEGSTVTIEQRAEEAIISFMDQLQEYLPYRNFNVLSLKDKKRDTILNVLTDLRDGLLTASQFDTLQEADNFISMNREKVKGITISNGTYTVEY